MRPHGSPADLEARWRRAVALLETGLGVRQVAPHIGCSPMSVSRWRIAVEAGGAAAAPAGEAAATPLPPDRCLICRNRSPDLICTRCRARIRGEALQRKHLAEREGRVS